MEVHIKNEYISLCSSKRPLHIFIYKVLVIDTFKASILSSKVSYLGVYTIASLKSFLIYDREF